MISNRRHSLKSPCSCACWHGHTFRTVIYRGLCVLFSHVFTHACQSLVPFCNMCVTKRLWEWVRANVRVSAYSNYHVLSSEHRLPLRTRSSRSWPHRVRGSAKCSRNCLGEVSGAILLTSHTQKCNEMLQLESCGHREAGHPITSGTTERNETRHV